MMVAGLCALVSTGLVRAACAVTAESVAKADVVFVGTLTGISPDRTATFEVEDAWRGDLRPGASVLVEAATVGLEMPPDSAGPFRYLVLADQRADGLHVGDNCAAYPFPWDGSYAAFRPVSAPAEVADGIPFPLFALVIGAAVMIGLGAFLVGSRRSPTPG